MNKAEDFKVGDTVRVITKCLWDFPSKLTRRYLAGRTGTVIEVYPSEPAEPTAMKNAVKVNWHRMTRRSTEKDMLHCPHHLEKLP